MYRKHFPAFVFSLVNGGIMLALALLWISLPRTFGDEAFLIKWTSLVKKSLLGIDEKPHARSVLLVDVSRSIEMVELSDPIYEEETGLQHRVIIDRGQIARFLDYVGSYGTDIPVLIMDLTLDHPGPQDSLLQAAIDRFPFPLIAAQNPDREVSAKSIRVPRGVAGYQSTDMQFLKYPLYMGKEPSLPLMAFGMASGVDYRRPGIWPRINGKPQQINPIIDFKIRPVDITDGQTTSPGKFSIRTLGTLLFEWEFWDKADIRQLLQEPVIIIGNFPQDRHETVFGTMPGPLVVYNAYLTLEAGESRIRWTWLCLLFGLFFWMSWRMYNEERFGRRSRWWRKSRTAVGKIVADSIDESLFLIIGTVLSYFIFNIHINILILLIYLKVVAFVLRRFVFRKSRVRPA